MLGLSKRLVKLDEVVVEAVATVERQVVALMLEEAHLALHMKVLQAMAVEIVAVVEVVEEAVVEVAA
jgi:hypothetical protein